MNRLAAALVLAALSPLLALIGFAVRVSMGRPVLFTQARSGRGGTTFDILKFRTMTQCRYAGEPDAERITRVGALLRNSSLDELPNFWNVLRGDMAFVGPRPLMAQYADLYNEREARRLDVRPGITGWQQVNGRNRLTWDEKFELDVWYVENRTWWLDFQILCRTPAALLRPSGRTHGSHVTMPVFDGQRSRPDRGSG